MSEQQQQKYKKEGNQMKYNKKRVQKVKLLPIVLNKW